MLLPRLLLALVVLAGAQALRSIWPKGSRGRPQPVFRLFASSADAPTDVRPSIWDLDTLTARFDDLGVPHAHLRSIYKFLLKAHLPQLRHVEPGHGEPEPDWTLVPDLPMRAAEVLRVEFTLSSSKVTDVRRPQKATPSGASLAPANSQPEREVVNAKLGLQLRSGHSVEAVLIGQGVGGVTVCVSSQVGCAKGCAFCETGTMGLRANLHAHEVLEQLWHAARLASTLPLSAAAAPQKAYKGAVPRQFYEVTNVVFMGMGEPLDNVDAVVDSISHMTEFWRLAPRRITVSTVGEKPAAIHRLAPSGVQLALSLHAPSDEVRREIVPTARDTAIEDILAAVTAFPQAAGAGRNRGSVMLEYVLIKGVNDHVAHGRQLATLLSGRPVWLNVIPYNPTSAGARFGFDSPSVEATEAFASAARQGTGADGKPLKVRIRWSTQAGQVLDAACGQLAVKKLRKTSEAAEPR